MAWLLENWILVLALCVVILVLCDFVKRFLSLSTEEQTENIKEWLLFACLEAEKELGSDTGKYKLRWVYNLFVTKFPHLVKIISFDEFSKLVDSALVEMKSLLADNKAVKVIVEGKKNEEN